MRCSASRSAALDVVLHFPRLWPIVWLGLAGTAIFPIVRAALKGSGIFATHQAVSTRTAGSVTAVIVSIKAG